MFKYKKCKYKRSCIKVKPSGTIKKANKLKLEDITA